MDYRFSPNIIRMPMKLRNQPTSKLQLKQLKDAIRGSRILVKNGNKHIVLPLFPITETKFSPGK
jgi:hypothetical protein